MLLVSDTSLRISLNAVREQSATAVIMMSLAFSNNSDQPISELTFMAAVTKVSQSLKLAANSHLILSLGILAQASAPKWKAARAPYTQRRYAENISQWSRTRPRRLGKITMEGILQGRNAGDQ
jgi:hypothetical protein